MNLLYGLFYKFKNQKMKMILLVLMYTILFGIVLLLMLLYNSVNKQANFIESYIENEVTIMPKYKPIYEDTANEIKKLPCVSEYNVMCLSGVRLKDCVPVIRDRDSYSRYLERRKIDAQEIWKRDFEPENAPQVKIIETNTTKNSVFFLNKGFTIKDGRHIRGRDKNAALISEEFAKKNNLHVGDFLETSTSKSDQAYYGNSLDLKLKVVGIYSHNVSDFDGNPQQDEANFIFTSLGPVSQKFIAAYHRMTVYLKPGSSMKELKKELTEGSLYIDPNNYSFGSSGEWSQILSKPLHNMQNMCQMLLIFVMSCMVIIILLIGAFYVRANMHNIGILLSMGVSKQKVVLQLLIEEYVPLLVGVLLAFLIGLSCMGKVTQIVDYSYTAEMKKIITEKNEELLDNVPGLKNSFNEIQVRGQVMRMDTNFKTEYSVDWIVLTIFFVFIFVFLLSCLGLQILYKMKHCSIKQILLS